MDSILSLINQINLNFIFLQVNYFKNFIDVITNFNVIILIIIIKN